MICVFGTFDTLVYKIVTAALLSEGAKCTCPKRRCYLVLCMQSVLIIQCFIWKVSWLVSVLCAKCPYYVRRYMQILHYPVLYVQRERDGTEQGQQPCNLEKKKKILVGGAIPPPVPTSYNRRKAGGSDFIHFTSQCHIASRPHGLSWVWCPRPQQRDSTARSSRRFE